MTWNDSGSGVFFGGNTVPSVLTVSGYDGPSRITASTGYVPAIKNGDAWTNTYTSGPTYGTVYVNTTFNEATSGALAGTTPAICANGCTGTWQAGTYGGVAAPWSYNGSGTFISNSPASQSPMYINAGVSDYTLRVTPTSASAGAQIIPRYTPGSAANYIALVTGNALEIVDVTAGNSTVVGTPSGSGCGTNEIVVVLAGSSVTATCGSNTTTGSLPSGSANITSTNVGFLTTTASSWSLNGFIVSSQ